MQKTSLLCIIIYIFINISSNALAYDYDKTEGNIVFRNKIGYFSTSNDIEADTINYNKSLMSNNYSFESEIDYFIDNNLSFSGSLGYASSKKSVGKYITDDDTIYDDGKIITIPITAMVNYHFAPYGAIRPYAGIGYHYTIVNDTFKKIDVDDANGLVAKIGTDWWANKKFGANFEIKKYWSTLDFDGKVMDNSINGKMKANPLVTSIGFTYRFNK